MSAPEDVDLAIDHANPLHLLRGQALDTYIHVEQLLMFLLEGLLEIDGRKAHAILFAIQNTRSRYELFETLLEQEFGQGIRRYWASCTSFLLKLALFRNAIAHWHPHFNVYISRTDASRTRAVHALRHPLTGSSFRALEQNDFQPFFKDCVIARQHLSALINLVRERPATLPEIFQQPIAHRNQAVLRQPQTAKAPPPQRPPSVAKLTEEEWLAKYRKEGRYPPTGETEK